MKAVMSLWTGTPAYRLNRRAAMVMSAAAAYVNRAWENTELVTDRHGLRVAERLGWEFCHTVVELDGFCPDYAAHVFALGKIHAQALQTGPHAHIDFDFLCYHLPPRRWREARVGYQSIDEPDGYGLKDRSALMQMLGVGPGAPVNCGIVGWTDLSLRDAYIERAQEAAFKAAAVNGDGLAISLVAEQAVLGALLRERGVRGEALIPLASQSAPDDFADCKFVHLWDRSKQDPEYARRLEKRFAEDFPAEHQAACRGWELLQGRGMVTR